jgi:hypothetical protein
MVVFACLAGAMCCAAQNVDDKNAKILKEQRFNTGDGRNGAAFATENGQIFREETDIDGNRVGQYSYIGDNGQTYTVKYTAGKDGFRIIEGDHIRATGQDAAQFDSDFETNEQPAPRAPTPIAAPVRQAAPIIDYDYEVVEEVDPNRNPFVNPHDPTHRDFAFNRNGADFAPKAAPAQTFNHQNLVPNCADCAGVNPFINPFDPSHTGLFPVAPRVQQQQQPRQPIQSVIIPRTETTTITPRRFFPPGQLKLNRFETGFNFDFES